MVIEGYGRLIVRSKVTREAPAQFILQLQYTDNPQNICEGVVTNALQICSKEPDEGITDVLRVVSVLWLF